MAFKRSLLIPLVVFLAGLGILLTTALFIFQPATQQALGKVPIGGPFRLTSHEGKPFTEADLKGKPFVVFFGFTHCPEVCPTTLYDLTQDMAALGKDGENLQAAFITVDPERDTPELMKTYLSSFDPRIVGLTGTEEEIAAAARTYKIYYRKVPTDGGYPYAGGVLAADRFVTSVVDFTPGACAGYGADSMPTVVEGPPYGGGRQAGGLDVVSLGNGGSITLSFAPNGIVDGPGADFVVFENVDGLVGALRN